MALLAVNLDVTTGKFVFSETAPVEFIFPPFYQEDSPTIAFRAFKRIRQNVAPFYERVAFSGYDLLISIGTAGSIIASANSWTLSDANTLLSGRLDLNTVGVNALANNAEVLFEARLFDGLGYQRAQQTVRVIKSVALVSTLQPVVNDQALGKIEAGRTYAPLQGCTGMTWIDELTGEETIIRLKGGSLLAEPIS
jgi:hypothetical protein